jgi:processive 1,2-diacylglycerol beta-glucosyltransferase
MSEYMRAADLFISKAGGISVAECFATGLAAVYTNNFPGHEAGNASYAQINEAAIIVQNKRELKNLLEKLLSKPRLVKKMGEAAKKLGSTDAAQKIVSVVFG